MIVPASFLLWGGITASYQVMSWVGLIYVQAEMMRKGNDKLLNNLKEGVIIVDEENKSVLFNNVASARHNSNLDESFGGTLGQDNGTVDQDKPIFAPVNAFWFRSPDFDFMNLSSSIRKLGNYMSMNEIIEQ